MGYGLRVDVHKPGTTQIQNVLDKGYNLSTHNRHTYSPISKRKKEEPTSHPGKPLYIQNLLILRGIGYRMISVDCSAAFDRIGEICYNKGTKGNTADRRSAQIKDTYKKVTLPLDGAVTFLCDLCTLSESTR